MRKGSFLMNLWTVRALVERAMTLTVRGTAAAQVQEVELPVASGKEGERLSSGMGVCLVDLFPCLAAFASNVVNFP